MTDALRPSRELERVVGKAAPKLTHLGITTVRDLLYHFPRRYRDVTQYSSLDQMQVGEYGTVIAEVVDVKARPTRRQGLHLVTVIITDRDSMAEVVFFGHGKAVEFRTRKELQPGTVAEFSGDVDHRGGMVQFKNATYEVLIPAGQDPDFSFDRPADVPGDREVHLRAMYPATAKVPNKIIRSSVELALKALLDLDLHDPIPEEIRTQRGLVSLDRALWMIHVPESKEEYREARKRFRYEEAFILQTALARRRADLALTQAQARPAIGGPLSAAFAAQLPFTLTQGQKTVAVDISADIDSDQPMNRLLQGEVGSGKTVLAVRAMLQVIDGGGQAALLAPTEVLAQQHARSIAQLLGPIAQGGTLDAPTDATSITLLTGSVTGQRRRQALADIASGAAGIVIGTHALIQEKVQFADLGLAVIDEQHRFGVQQRQALREKSAVVPHQLFMTATPIPRSVAMTVFGDVEVSTLREIPAGRQPITTHVVPAAKASWLDRTWAKVAEEVGKGNRAYVVAPRISPTDSEEGTVLLDAPQAGQRSHPVGSDEQVSSVVEVARALAESGPLSQVPLGVLHGQLPPAEKESVMSSFARGDTPVLVTTTVVEVGVDVPEATVMVVLDADRFGLSQLHQLRGRIGRGSEPGVCLLVSGAEPGTEALERLQIMASTTDGFVLAEEDLKARKEGDILGAAQSGRTRSLKLLRVITDRDIIADARADARELIESDPNLVQHPELITAIAGLIDPDREEYLDRA